MSHASTLIVLAGVLLLAAVSMDAAAAHPLAGRQLRQLMQQGSKYDQCNQAFNKAGGRSSIESRMKAACALEGNFDINKCCGEAKSAMSVAPADCLCDPAVWSDVENGILGAGINGLTSTTLKDFTKGCGIKNRGAGTC